MSARQNPTEDAGAHGTQPATYTSDAVACTEQSHWRQERLHEARSILADIAQHPDTLIVLACRVVCDCSLDPDERDDALGMMRLLSPQPSEGASTASKGSAA